MKKRLISIIASVCLIVCSVFTFVGCDLYHDNNSRYYKEVVAKVGDEEITRNEVLTMFNYYYYTNYYYYYGYSEDDVYEMVLEALIKNKIKVIEAKKIPELALTEEDKTRIWQSVFEYVDSQIDSIETEIRTTLGVEEEAEEEKSTTDYKTYSDEYVKTIPGQEAEEPITIKTKEEFLKDLTASVDKNVDYYKYLAYRKYLSQLKRSAEIYEKNPGTTEQIFDKELQRLYDYYEESRIVTKYNNYCKSKLNITNEQIEQKYIELLNTQKQNFDIGSNYNKTITSSSNEDLILYNKSSDHFYVQQILLKYADYNDDLRTSEYLKGLDSYSSSSSSSLENDFVKEYQEEREKYALGEGNLNMDYINPDTGHTNEDNDGNELTFTFAEFDGMIADLQAKYDSGLLSDSEFIKGFYKLKFEFSKDSNVTDLTKLSNQYGYCLSTNSADSNSYVTEFSDCAYETYNEFKNGNLKITRCITDFGVHYLLCTNTTTAGEKGLDYQYSPVTNETVGDYIYELLVTEALSNCISEVESSLYNKYQNSGLIEIKFDNYKDVL